ncbi:MAG: AAA family ATPase [Bacteroidaceae bacterium]
MIKKSIEAEIKAFFTFNPTSEQELTVQKIAQFLQSTSSEALFLLKGYAGTGKTTVVAALVRMLLANNRQVVLLAPTGRAARVFSSYAKTLAMTIHRKIYRQETYGDLESHFKLNENKQSNTLFIVDEASMVGHQCHSYNQFGSGSLLDDLIKYVYQGDHCQLMLIGDQGQLPPVGAPKSMALDIDQLKSYGLDVTEIEMKQVVRQAENSGILYQATLLRQAMAADSCTLLPKIAASRYPDIEVVSGEYLLESIDNAYYQWGIEETIIITKSNKRANLYNQGIRARILDREEELERGDWLMIGKNNYYWTEQNNQKGFLANGEMAEVKRVKRKTELYGFDFAYVELKFPEHPEMELEAMILLNTLRTESPTLSREENEKLYTAVLKDYEEISIKQQRVQALKKDSYYNALQVKYAYAITCHKSQGGQWHTVFLDGAFLPENMLNEEGFRWLYTAMTRATDKLYLVNYPSEGIE